MKFNIKMNNYNLMLLLLLCIFIIIFSMIYFENKRQRHFENMENYYKTRPKINTLYKDDNNVEISELSDYGKCLIINNEIQLCSKKENIYHEMIVHFPTQYISKNIENVVIVGGGDLMTLREVMKYKTIKKVYMLELSETIVELCKEYFNQNDFSDDNRVEIIYGDANKSIDDIIRIHKEDIDMVIVDTTEDNEANLPIDTPSFFYKCFLLLNKTGILVKNGIGFKQLFEEYDDLDTITYKINIPYFQDLYTFVIASKKSNKIKKHNIDHKKWNMYNIQTQVYNIKDHSSYIYYDEYSVGHNNDNKVSYKDYKLETGNVLLTDKDIMEENMYLFEDDNIEKNNEFIEDDIKEDLFV